MSDTSSSITAKVKKSSQSLKDISRFFHYFTLSNEKQKPKTLTNIRRKKLNNETFLPPAIEGWEKFNSYVMFFT